VCLSFLPEEGFEKLNATHTQRRSAPAGRGRHLHSRSFPNANANKSLLLCSPCQQGGIIFCKNLLEKFSFRKNVCG
jgi:hypothetical protein